MQDLPERIIRMFDEQLTEFPEIILEPTRVMISMMRPGSRPAFHIACICPRGLVM